MKDVLTYYDRIGSKNIFKVESLPFLMAPLTIEDPNDDMKKSDEYEKEEKKYRKERSQFNVLMPYDETKLYPLASSGEK